MQLSVRCYVNLTLVKKMLQVKYVPNTIDIDIKSRLNTLKENLISINSNSNNNNNNNNNFLPPRPPSSPLPSLHKQDNFVSIFFSTTSNNSLTKLFWTSTKNTTTHAISTATTAWWSFFNKHKIWWKCHRKTRKSNWTYRQCLKRGPWTNRNRTWRCTNKSFICKSWWSFCRFVVFALLYQYFYLLSIIYFVIL